MGDTEVKSLDMANGHDRRLVRRAVRRWEIQPEDRNEFIYALKQALTSAVIDGDRRDIVSTMKVFVAMEAQNQADEHLSEKYERADNGEATEVVRHYVVNLPQPRRDAE